MKILPAILPLILISAVAGADEISGRIDTTDLIGKNFEISGINISASGAAITNEMLEQIEFSELKLRQRVEVTGSLGGSGSMRATKIKKVFAGYDKVNGMISNVSGPTNVITVGGIKIKVPANAIVEDQQDRQIKFENLVPGNVVNCKGLWTGPRQLMARKVELQ